MKEKSMKENGGIWEKVKMKKEGRRKRYARKWIQDRKKVNENQRKEWMKEKEGMI